VPTIVAASERVVAASWRDAGTIVSGARRLSLELLTPAAVPICVGISLAGLLGLSAMPMRFQGGQIVQA
jgi:hypothetical protein